MAKYVKRKRTRKRSYKRRKRRRKRRRVNYNTPSGMPKQRTTKLRYVDTYRLDSVAGVLTGLIFRANSIFDPYQSGIGHQPMGHDQWALLYNHYHVLGSKLTCKFVQPPDNTAPGNVGAYLSDGSTQPYVTASEFAEAKRGSFTQVTPTNTGPRTIKSYFSAKTFFNCTDVNDNRQLGAAVGANPSEDAYFQIWYEPSDNSTQQIYVTVTIDYVVQFNEPKDLAQS